MIKLGNLVIGNTRNALIGINQFSFASQIIPRSKGLEAVKNSNPKWLSSIAITYLSNAAEFNSSQYVTKLKKSTDAKNNSSILLVDKTKGQRYSKEEDKKLLDHVNEYGKSSSSLKLFSKDFGRSFNSISDRLRKLESANEYDTNHEPREWKFEEDEKLVNYVFKLKSIKSTSITSIKDTTLKDFEDFAKEFKRSTKSVYLHWLEFVIPCLKPHMKHLASTTDFKKDVLRLIEEGNFNKCFLFISIFIYLFDDELIICFRVTWQGCSFSITFFNKSQNIIF